jgi:hypothetical protein
MITEVNGRRFLRTQDACSSGRRGLCLGPRAGLVGLHLREWGQTVMERDPNMEAHQAEVADVVPRDLILEVRPLATLRERKKDTEVKITRKHSSCCG